MLNHVTLLGRMAQEPEIRYTTSGTPVASFDLAVQVPSKDRNTPPDNIPIVCWRDQAEFCGRYLFQVVPPCGGHQAGLRASSSWQQFQVVPPCGGHL